MRTYEIHASAKQVQRTTGRSSIAASAYRTASLIYDNRTGLTHDYRNKQGMEHSEILSPDNAPAWAQDRAKLWNAVEEKENRINSMTAREWVIAFPAEFNIFQRREAGAAIAQERVDRLNTSVEISYHKPDKIIDKDTGEISDNQNHHAHIMFPTRSLDVSEKDGWSKNKYRHYSHDKIEINGKKIKSSEHEINEMRSFAAEVMNKIAQRDGLAVKTEHLSFEERGIDKEPTQHLGYVANDMKKNGKESIRENINLKIKASNDNREELKKQKKIILLDHERKKRTLNKQIKERDAAELQQEKSIKEEAKNKARAAEKTRVEQFNKQHQEEKQAQALKKNKIASYEKYLAGKIIESRKKWNIDELTQERDKAKALLDKNSGFIARLTGRKRAAAAKLDAQEKNLAERMGRFETDIVHYNKNRPQWVIDRELKKQGIEPKKAETTAQKTVIDPQEKAKQNKQDNLAKAQEQLKQKASQNQKLAEGFNQLTPTQKQVVTASPEQINKNIKAQQGQNISTASFMDGLNKEQKAKIEAYKQSNPEQDNEKQGHKKGQSPDLE